MTEIKGEFMDHTGLFSEMLKSYSKMHFAAHSHHFWPDCTFEAQKQHWLDSARLTDEKWGHIFGKVMNETKAGIASILNLSDPQQIVLASNTHEFCDRLLSCFLDQPKVKVLTVDKEFYSFRRQVKRYSELKSYEVEWLSLEPIDTFEERLYKKIALEEFDMIFLSQVYFTNGYHIPQISKIVEKIKSQKTVIAIDGYHAFCAIPTDLSSVEDRIFYMAGGYKYAMSGEGVCFMHVPKNNALRPVNTGWFAEFENLEKGTETKVVTYPKDGSQFIGSTIEPCGAYRFNAVQRMWKENGLTVSKIHSYVEELKSHFVKKLKSSNFKMLKYEDVILCNNELPPSHFVSFKTPDAMKIVDLLKHAGIYVDCREGHLRFGFGLYHNKESIENLFKKLQNIPL